MALSTASMVIAYYLSRFNDTALHHLGFKTQTAAFERASEITGDKANSLRNLRDEFDLIHSNSRVGHKKDKLSPSRQMIVDKYSIYNEQELFNIVNGIFTEKSHVSEFGDGGILTDLNDLAIKSRTDYQELFQYGDVILSEDFIKEFGACLRSKKNDVSFLGSTSVVTTTGTLKIFVPNQWYVIAAYMADYVKTLHTYKKHLIAILQSMKLNTKEQENFIRMMKAEPDDEKRVEFKTEAIEYFSSLHSADAKMDAEFLVAFLSSYEWWFGSKTIDRSDFFVSPVLNLLGVVNVSQAYIADICLFYATNNTLLEKAKNLISSENIPLPKIGMTTPGVFNRMNGGINLLVYGAPGTGKSRYLEDRFRNSHPTRVVFHPEYTYFEFIGSYKPVPLYKPTDKLHTLEGEPFLRGEPVIDYQFVPGPFIKVYIKACLNPGEMHTLLIEEINRANAAAVFGEVFQMLDRNPDGGGEYSFLPPPDLLNYLNSIEDMKGHIESGMIMPSNMNIVATMNSADQGVTQIDGAFKRRWEYKYIQVTVSDTAHEKAILEYAGNPVYWGEFVTAINEKLKDLRVEEDRLIGPYFVRPGEVGKSSAIDKLLLYLWDDVIRHRRDQFFSNNIRTFAELVENFQNIDVLNLVPEYLDPEELRGTGTTNNDSVEDESTDSIDETM